VIHFCIDAGGDHGTFRFERRGVDGHPSSPPNKPRGVARVDDRRVINGIFYVLRTGSPWRDLPEHYGPYTTVYNRFNRWARAGVWVRVFEALAAKSPKSMALIDSSIIRAHQHAAGGKKGARITPSVVLVAD
jgi:transposase